MPQSRKPSGRRVVSVGLRETRRYLSARETTSTRLKSAGELPQQVRLLYIDPRKPGQRLLLYGRRLRRDDGGVTLAYPVRHDSSCSRARGNTESTAASTLRLARQECTNPRLNLPNLPHDDGAIFVALTRRARNPHPAPSEAEMARITPRQRRLGQSGYLAAITPGTSPPRGDIVVFSRAISSRSKLASREPRRTRGMEIPTRNGDPAGPVEGRLLPESGDAAQPLALLRYEIRNPNTASHPPHFPAWLPTIRFEHPNSTDLAVRLTSLL